jgi:hypothetical protein
MIRLPVNPDDTPALQPVLHDHRRRIARGQREAADRAPPARNSGCGRAVRRVGDHEAAVLAEIERWG